jgi:cytidine diphosphoramidate kinase
MEKGKSEMFKDGLNRCYWITGLSASGKTTYSTMLVEYLRSSGKKVILLDGDELRKVFSDEAYTREERIALGMRYSRLCQLLSIQGVDVVIAVIGLFKEIHKWNRENIPNYIEIFFDIPIDELINRDPKGLYKRYDSGEIKNIAGMDLPIDIPECPDIHIEWSEGKSIESMFDELLEECIKIN